MFPIYEGVPPENNTNKVQILRPGKYLATVLSADPIESFGVAQIQVTFEAKRQGQIREYIEASINDNSNKAWKIWRLLGALDMPSEEYWAAKDKEPHKWDVLQEIRDAIEMEREVYIEVGTYEKRDGTPASTIDKMHSPHGS